MKKFLNIIILFIMGLFLSGCATLNYVGEDYSANNNQTIKTNEDFVFNTYKKSLNNINLKAGISKTAVPEILALYIQIENLSYETPYIFKVEDLRITEFAIKLLNIFKSPFSSDDSSNKYLKCSIKSQAFFKTFG